MGEVSNLKENMNQLQKQMSDISDTTAVLSDQSMDVSSIRRSLDELVDSLSEQVVSQELSDKLIAFVKEKYASELENCESSKSPPLFLFFVL